MKSKVKIVKWLVFVTSIMFLITYSVSLIPENGLWVFGCVCISQSFLLTIFGGAFSSALVTLGIEIFSYYVEKEKNEYALYNCALRLYVELFLIRGNINDYLIEKNRPIPHNLLDQRMSVVKACADTLKSNGYFTFCKKNSIVIELNRFRDVVFLKEESFINSGNLLRCLVLEIKLYNAELLGGKDCSVSSSDIRVEKYLLDRVRQCSDLLEEIAEFLIVLDEKCGHRFGWMGTKERIEGSYVSLFEFERNLES